MKPAVAAVIVAGGQGLRFGGPVRKQYLKLGGRTLLQWSAIAFERAPSIASLTIVVPKEDVKRVRRQTTLWKLQKLSQVIAGGASRQASVLLGVRVAAGTWVAVHDAVRPLVSAELIEKVIVGARKTGAAIAAVPSRDTVKIADRNGFIKSTPARAHAWLAQTPQVIRRDLFLKAHGLAGRFTGTDDAELVERLGIRVRLVAADAENFKVTFPSDFDRAKQILRRRVRGRK